MTGNIFHNMYIATAGCPFIMFSLLIIRVGRRLVIVSGFFMMAVVSVVLVALVSYDELPGDYNRLYTIISDQRPIRFISFDSYTLLPNVVHHLIGVSGIAIPTLAGLGRVLSLFSFSGLYVITSEIFATNVSGYRKYSISISSVQYI